MRGHQRARWCCSAAGQLAVAALARHLASWRLVDQIAYRRHHVAMTQQLEGVAAPLCTWSTNSVPAARAFEYWRDLICDTFVQLAASPIAAAPFAGRIEHVAMDEVELSTVSAGGHEVRRTKRLIARSDDESVLASIQVVGTGYVLQDGRVAELRPGAMAFYDSSRPYTLRFAGPFEQVVVQLPRRLLSASTLGGATAVALDPHGSGHLVADFFVGLARQQRSDRAGVTVLAPHAVGLLRSALGIAAGAAPDARSVAALDRARVVAHLRRHADNPDLNMDSVAAACHLSRRTLFRLFADEPEGAAGTLRRLRVERAKVLLRSDPRRSLAAVAACCGFAGQAQLHRAFRVVTGSTPALYREGSQPVLGRGRGGTDCR